MKTLMKLITFSLLLFTIAAFNQSAFGSNNSSVEFFGAKAYGHGFPYFIGLFEGDYNGDGKVDLLTASGNKILFYKGDGSGEFLTPPVVAYTRSFSPLFPTVGDFNNDNISDFVIVDRTTDKITIVHGNTAGTFESPLVNDTTAEFVDEYTTAIDYDNDGNLDIVGHGQLPGMNTLELFRGNGNGTFSAGTHMPISALAEDIKVGDFNNDNLPDITYGKSSDLVVLKNLGGGNFGELVTIDSIPFGFASRVVADFNNDGNEDIVAVQDGSLNPLVVIWLGDGNYGFTKSQNFTIPSKENVFISAAGDFDNDSNPDLVFSSRNRVIISKGLGDGTFGPQRSYIDGGNGLALVDLNSDNSLDIATAETVLFGSPTAGAFAVLLNDQNGNFLSAPAIDTGFGTLEIEVDDLDANGLKDILILSERGGGDASEILIFFQSEASNLSKVDKFGQTSKALGDGVDASSVVIGDFTGDNKKDILAVGDGAFGGTQNAWLLTNQGSQNFTQTFFQITTNELYDIEAADLNSDGKLDLVTTSVAGVNVSFGLGNGTFAAPTNFLPGVQSVDIVIADFNNDLKPDIAVNQQFMNKIQVLLNNGTGSFTNTQTLEITNTGFYDLASADMNSDGNADLVVSTTKGVATFNGVGNAQFSPAIPYSIIQGFATGLTIADFSRDGKPDVALMTGSNTISVLINNGFGGLAREALWSGGADMKSIVSADLDNDEIPDLIFGFSLSQSAYTKILYNITPEPLIKPNNPLFDFDGDGRTDISIFRPSLGQWWYQRSSDNVTNAFTFGVSTDIPVPEDFTGDGKTDIAFFRGSSSEWFILRSEDSTFYSYQFGANGDIPAPGDFDGDGIADSAVFRPSSSNWFIDNSSGGTTIETFGLPDDKPTIADFDGDGRDDIAIFRPSLGQWWQFRSSEGVIAYSFGMPGDKTVQGDYSGDGKADVALFRPSTNEWFILRSENGTFYSFPFGANGDIPTPGDYDGDGLIDAAVFRPSTTTWFINGSTSGTQIVGFGLSNDIPLASSYSVE